MAGTAIRIGTGDEASVEIDGERIIWVYTDLYKVPADSATESKRQVLNATGLPFVNLSTHPDDALAICKSKRITRIAENQKYFEVAVDYDTRPSSDNNEQDQPDDITADDINVSWSSESITIYEDRDLDDKEFANSAGEPFSGGLAIELAIPILTVQRYETAFLPSVILDYENQTNSDTFYGASAGQALISSIIANKTFNSDSDDLWNVTYKIKFNLHRTDGWKTVKKLNQGSFFVDASDSSKQKKFMTDADPSNDVPALPTIGLLDSNGDNIGTTPSFESFRVKDSVAFAPLNLE